MSLLYKGNVDAILYPEEVVTDRDGNTKTQASESGIPFRLRVEPHGQSGTASRRGEQHQEGFETEKVLRARIRRQDDHLAFGAQAKVEIDGQMWSVFGDEAWYLSSPRTTYREISLWRS